MSMLTVEAPAGFVPEVAIAYVTGTGPVVVGADAPLPVTERSFRGAVPIVVGTDQSPQRGIAIVATTAGTVQVKLADDSVLALPVATGLSILPLAAKGVVAAGTTAVATYSNLV